MKAEPRSRHRSLPAYAGLLAALLLPLVYTHAVDPLILERTADATASALIGMSFMWLVAIGIVIGAWAGKGGAADLLGWRAPTGRQVLLALGAGLLLSLLVPLLTIAGDLLFPGQRAIVETAEGNPAWLLALAVVTAAVTEEVLFRSYPLERLLRLGARPWLALLVSTAAFFLLHLPGWPPAHAVSVVLPLGVLLGLLYLWQRNLVVVVIAHLLIDLPLVIMAMAAN